MTLLILPLIEIINTRSSKNSFKRIETFPVSLFFVLIFSIQLADNKKCL